MDGELEILGERIAEQAAHLDAAMHRVLTDLREFDTRGGWYRQGALSCAHWLSWRVGWDLGTARERVRVAGKLGEFPVIDEALRIGEISYSKVRAMMRVATQANESELLEYARLMTASHLEKLCRKYATVQRHGKESTQLDDEQRRFVRRRDTEDGMVKIEAVLHPEEAELVWTMLNHAAAQLTHEPARAADVAESPATASSTTRTTANNDMCPASNAAESPAVQWSHRPDPAVHERAGGALHQQSPGSSVSGLQQPAKGMLQQRADATKRAFDRADALLAVAQTYLRGDRVDRSPIDITLTIPIEGLRAESADPLEVGEMGESFISRVAARRLACDAGVVEVIEDERGSPLSVGRKRRTITGSLKRALRTRDKTCTYPGCTNRLFLEGHHIKHWADGGETSLENGCLLCTTHHHYVHEYGYTIEIGSDQRPQFRSPHGWLVNSAPTGPAPVDVGWPTIRAANQPLNINAETIACEWDGSKVNYGTIVHHLLVADGLD